MNYRGIEYRIMRIELGVWRWHMRVGGKPMSGTTATALQLLAIRRVKGIIDRELRAWRREGPI
jgi:hypothetical protein